jgi:hypothetical protein
MSEEGYYKFTIRVDRKVDGGLAEFLERQPGFLRRAFCLQALEYYRTHFDEIEANLARLRRADNE